MPRSDAPTPASLDLEYRIWYAGTYVDPREFLEDIDLYLKLTFIDPDFEPDGGLLIEVGGQPWNSHETFDTVFNMACWFTAAAVLASGEQQSFNVWAWEESNCRITRLGDDLLRLEDPPTLPPTIVGFRDFIARLLEPGSQLLALQRAAAGRLAELCLGAEECGPPAIAREWAGELPEEHLDEQVVGRKGPFVELRGWSLDRRWGDVMAIPMSATDLDRLERDLAALKAYVAMNPERF